MEYQRSLRSRGFTQEASGSWHGPWGIIIPSTWNTITTTSLADSAREETIRLVDNLLQVKRRDFNAH